MHLEIVGLLWIRRPMFLWGQAQQAEHTDGVTGTHSATAAVTPAAPARQCQGSWSCQGRGFCLQRQLLSTGLVLPLLHHPHSLTAPQPGAVLSKTMVTPGPKSPAELWHHRGSRSWRLLVGMRGMDGAGMRNSGHWENKVHKPGRTWQPHLLSA